MKDRKKKKFSNWKVVNFIAMNFSCPHLIMNKCIRRSLLIQLYTPKWKCSMLKNEKLTNSIDDQKNQYKSRATTLRVSWQSKYQLNWKVYPWPPFLFHTMIHISMHSKFWTLICKSIIIFHPILFWKCTFTNSCVG
jgi:hypothetical protein